MLTEVEIKNFRQCANVKISDLGPIVALVGRNGAGKTNIQRAIDMAARIATAADRSVFFALIPEMVGLPTDPTRISLRFDVGESRYRYQLAVDFGRPPIVANAVEEMLYWGDEQHPVLEKKENTITIRGKTEPIRVPSVGPMLPTVSALFPPGNALGEHARAATQFLSTIRYYPLDESASAALPERFVESGDYTTWLTAYNSGGDVGDSVSKRLVYLSLNKKEEFSVLKQMLGPNGLGLIDDLSFNELKIGQPGSPGDPRSQETLYHFRYRVGSSPFAVSYDGLSLGTRRVIRMLVYLLFDKSAVMLLEQPEDSLHQGMTKKVIGLLRNNAQPAQLIMSSHSSALLNKLKPEEIRLVYLNEGFTEARALTADEIQAAAKFMNEDGPLYDFLDSIQEG